MGERMELRRQQQKAAMKKVFQENLEENAEKEEARMRQQELDMEAMKEYNRILDQQEEMRAQELQARMDKQKALMEKMKENVQKQGDEDARRAAKQKEEADARAIEMERNKAAKLKEMRHDTQKFLFKQMAEKDEKKEQALELKRLQASILEADTQEYMQMEKQKASDRRVRNIEHRIELEDQIADRAKEVVRKYAMSGAEVKMNRQLLDLVDKTLQERDAYLTSHADPDAEQM